MARGSGAALKRRIPLSLYVDGHFTNCWDASCFVALCEKQLEFTTARALLREGQGVPDALRERGGTGRVPALQHGDVLLTESLAIVEYLEDVFPPPMYARLLPEQPVDRARARQIMAWLRSDMVALRAERPWQLVVYPTTPIAPLSPQAAREADELLALVDWSDRQGALSQWTVAQADLAFAVMRIAHAGHPISAVCEHLLARNRQRPSVRAYLEHPRPPNPPPRPRS